MADESDKDGKKSSLKGVSGREQRQIGDFLAGVQERHAREDAERERAKPITQRKVDPRTLSHMPREQPKPDPDLAKTYEKVRQAAPELSFIDPEIFKKPPEQNGARFNTAVINAARQYLNGIGVPLPAGDSAWVEKAALEFQKRQENDSFLEAAGGDPARKLALEIALDKKEKLTKEFTALNTRQDAAVKNFFNPLLKKAGLKFSDLNKPTTAEALKPHLAALGEEGRTAYQKLIDGQEKLKETATQLQALQNRPDIKKLGEIQIRDTLGSYVASAVDHSDKALADYEKHKFWSAVQHKMGLPFDASLFNPAKYRDPSLNPFADNSKTGSGPQVLALEDLKKNHSFQHAARLLYEMKEGHKPDRMTSADLADYAVNEVRWFNNNILSTANTARQALRNATDEQRLALLYVMDSYEKTGPTMEGLRAGIKQGLVFDPSMWASAAAGVLTAPLGGEGFWAAIAARFTFKEGAKTGIRKLFNEGVEKLAGAEIKSEVAGQVAGFTLRGVGKAMLAGGLSALPDGAITNTLEQFVRMKQVNAGGLQLAQQNGFDLVQFGLATGMSAGAGILLGGGANTVAHGAKPVFNFGRNQISAGWQQGRDFINPHWNRFNTATNNFIDNTGNALRRGGNAVLEANDKVWATLLGGEPPLSPGLQFAHAAAGAGGHTSPAPGNKPFSLFDNPFVMMKKKDGGGTGTGGDEPVPDMDDDAPPTWAGFTPGTSDAARRLTGPGWDDPIAPSPVGRLASIKFFSQHAKEYWRGFVDAPTWMQKWVKPIQDLGAGLQSNNSINLLMHMNPSLAPVNRDGVNLNYVYKRVVKNAAGEIQKDAEGNPIVKPVIDLLGSLNGINNAAQGSGLASISEKLQAFTDNLGNGTQILRDAAHILHAIERNASQTLDEFEENAARELAYIQHVPDHVLSLRELSVQCKEDASSNHLPGEAKDGFIAMLASVPEGRPREIILNAIHELDTLTPGMIIDPKTGGSYINPHLLTERAQQGQVRNIYRETAKALETESRNMENAARTVTEQVENARQQVTQRVEKERERHIEEVTQKLENLNRELQNTGKAAQSTFQPIIEATNKLQDDFSVIDKDIAAIHADPNKTTNVAGGSIVARISAAEAEPHLTEVATFAQNVKAGVEAVSQNIDSTYAAIQPLGTLIESIKSSGAKGGAITKLRTLANDMEDGNWNMMRHCSNPLPDFENAFNAAIQSYQRAETAVLANATRKTEKDAGWGLFTGSKQAGAGASYWIRHRDAGITQMDPTPAHVEHYNRLVQEGRVMPFKGKFTPDYSPNDTVLTDNSAAGSNGRWKEATKWIEFAHDNPGRIGGRDLKQPMQLNEFHSLTTKAVINKGEELLDPAKNNGKPDVDAFRDVLYRWFTLHYNRGKGGQRIAGISVELVDAIKEKAKVRPDIWTPELIDEIEHMRVQMIRLGSNWPRIRWEEVIGFFRNRIFAGDYTAETQLGNDPSQREEFVSAMQWQYGHGIQWLAKIQGLRGTLIPKDETNNLPAVRWRDIYGAKGDPYHSGVLWALRTPVRIISEGPPIQWSRNIKPTIEQWGLQTENATLNTLSGGVFKTGKPEKDAEPKLTNFIPRPRGLKGIGKIAGTAVVASALWQGTMPADWQWADPGGWVMGQGLGAGSALINTVPNFAGNWIERGAPWRGPWFEPQYKLLKVLPNRGWQENVHVGDWHIFGKPRSGFFGLSAPGGSLSEEDILKQIEKEQKEAGISTTPQTTEAPKTDTKEKDQPASTMPAPPKEEGFTPRAPDDDGQASLRKPWGEAIKDILPPTLVPSKLQDIKENSATLAQADITPKKQPVPAANKNAAFNHDLG